MPTASPKIPPMPPPQVPLLDPATGLLSKVWFEYLRALDQTLRQVRAEIP